MIRLRLVRRLAVMLSLVCAVPVWAGQSAAPSAQPAAADGATIRTVRAFRIAEEISLDGRLDEDVYTAHPAIGDFIQQEPREGEPATEKTDAWIFFDNRNIYLGFRCWDSHPERYVANEMRRDAQNITQNESIGVLFDTFNDRRNGFYFQISLLGGMRDGIGTDETNSNINWNTVWDARTSRFEQGWTAEMIIPFKSLRYQPGTEQTWGVNFRRIVKWKNEHSYLTRVPAFLALRGLIASSKAATMTGIETPAGARNLELKPYAITRLSTDRAANPAFNNKGTGDVGFDVKYGLTKGLILDLTYNTDFAQVEDDIQQVNLTRFNQFYPERRDFFLEGQGLFMFGGQSATAGEGGGSNTPIMFFSRRIGLNNSREIPIVGGARVTGRAGAYTMGLLNLQADDDRASGTRPTNFSVVRLKRDIGRRNNVGVIYTRRDETSGSRDPGHTFGVDALYSASQSLNVNAYFARTYRPELEGDDTSHLLKFDYTSDRYGLQLEHLDVGGNFNPEVGFLRRVDFQRQFAQARFSPRPNRTRWPLIRQFTYQGSFEYIEDGGGIPAWREGRGQFATDFQNSDSVTFNYVNDYELLPRPFGIGPGTIVPAGGYDYQSGQVSYTRGVQHKVSGTLSYLQGSFYDGTRRTLGFSTGKVDVNPHFSVEPGISANWVDLPYGEFTSTVITARTILMVSPRLITSVLIQHNSSTKTLSTNARLRWEYQPGSELYVVYTDGRDTLQQGYPDLVNRAFVVKINRLFRF